MNNALDAIPSHVQNGSGAWEIPVHAPKPMHVEKAVAPTGVERFFEPEEIIVSKTDVNGRITYANQVFLRVSGYVEREVIGQPHSFIRHPEMPRVVYKMLWDNIQRGDEIFAYVKNLTKNGDHYWVLAHVTPTFDTRGNIVGFHSNRRCPDRGHVTTIQRLYDQLLAAERGHLSKAEAIASSMKVLEHFLAQQKCSYDEFIFALIRE